METDTTYNGWANRETWAFVLHCDNSIGTEFIIESMEIDSEESDWQIGTNVIEFVQSMLDEARAGWHNSDWVDNMRDDVGSFWRIDEREIGRWAKEFAEMLAS